MCEKDRFVTGPWKLHVFMSQGFLAEALLTGKLTHILVFLENKMLILYAKYKLSACKI